MKLTAFNKFQDIPGHENLIDAIPIFATPEYSDYLKYIKGYDTIWFTSTSDALNYLIPFSVKKKGPFKKGLLLSAIISYGQNSTIEFEKKFLNEIILYIRRHKLCDWIEQCPNWAIFNSFPDGAIHAPFGTYRINLAEKTEEELFQQINRKDRQDIKKAIRENVEIIKDKKGHDDSIFLINKTLKTAKIGTFTKNNFDTICSFFRSNILDFTAYYNNIPQSSCIYLFNSFSTYAMYAGSNKPFRGSNSLLHWEAIKDSKKRNIKYFDFVGARINPELNSKYFRIQKFKSHFGAELIQGYLWKFVFNKHKLMIYKILHNMKIILKGKLNKGDIIDQEIKRLNLN